MDEPFGALDAMTRGTAAPRAGERAARHAEDRDLRDAQRARSRTPRRSRRAAREPARASASPRSSRSTSPGPAGSTRPRSRSAGGHDHRSVAGRGLQWPLTSRRRRPHHRAALEAGRRGALARDLAQAPRRRDLHRRVATGGVVALEGRVHHPVAVHGDASVHARRGRSLTGAVGVTMRRAAVGFGLSMLLGGALGLAVARACPAGRHRIDDHRPADDAIRRVGCRSESCSSS